MNLGVVWIDETQTVGTAPHPNMVAFDVMGAALIFMMCCWQIPKLFAAVLGGAPALAGGDLWGTGMAVVGAGVAAASLGIGAVAGTVGGGSALAGTGSATTAGSSSSGVAGSVAGVSSGGSTGGPAGGSVPPPTSPPRGPSTNDGGPRRQPDPPAKRAQTETVSVEVKSVLPTSDRTYEVDWVETTRDLYGAIKATDRWKGSFSIAFNPPTDERLARVNPLGIYVTSASWAKVL